MNKGARRLILGGLQVLTAGLIWLGAVQSAPVDAITVNPNTPTSVGAPVDLLVPNTTLTVAGCASPEALVTIYDSSSPVGSVLADANGNFSKTVLVNKSGIKNIRLYFDDVNGRTSSIVSRNIALTPHSNTVLNVLLPTTIEHEPEPVVAGNYLIFRGTTCPQSLVNVRIDNNFTLAAKADRRGNWYAIADTSRFYIGAHTYEAISEKSGSNLSDLTQKFLFTVSGNTQPPPVPTSNLTAPIITQPQDGFLSNSPHVTFSGTAPKNTAIEILVDDSLAGSVFTNAYGQFTFQLTMRSLQHKVSLRACNAEGCSPSSTPVTVKYSGDIVACDLEFKLGSYRFSGIETGHGIDLDIQNLPGNQSQTAIIDWGDASIERLSLLDRKEIKFHHIYKQPGLFNGTITMENENGCKFSRYFTAQVSEGDDTNLLWAGLITTLGLASAIAGYRLYRLRSRLAEKKLALAHESSDLKT